jgi:hypothetical protein
MLALAPFRSPLLLTRLGHRVAGGLETLTERAAKIYGLKRDGRWPSSCR